MQSLLPSKCCIFCDKSFLQVGGFRITAQALRGSLLSISYQSGGDNKAPRRSVKLAGNSGKYVVVWGDDNIWNTSVVEKLKAEYSAGFQPWFRQKCGKRICSTCGSPLNYAMGSDIIKDDGHIDHCGVFPFEPGCNNQSCENHK